MDNSSKETVKLTIAHLRPDMILAEDAVTKQGVVILAKNTCLDSVNYKKLASNNVINITVWADSIDDSNTLFSDNVSTGTPVIKRSSNPEKEKKEFQRFRITYRKKINELKNCMNAIHEGETKDQKELYSIIDGIVSDSKCNSDLIHYIGYLKKMDDFTYTHSINVAILCNILASWLHLSQNDIEKAAIAGMLHDIGKSSINLSEEEIMDEEKLTGEKLDQFKTHPQLGYESLKNQDLDDEIKQAVLNHHERIDGSGYPNGLKGGELSSICKIVAICDTYDYLLSVKHICPFDVIKNFEHQYLGILDTEYLIQFSRNIIYTYAGCYVNLSNGKKAQVMFINPLKPSRPLVMVGDEIIDLVEQKDITITGMA